MKVEDLNRQWRLEANTVLGIHGFHRKMPPLPAEWESRSRCGWGAWLCNTTKIKGHQDKNRFRHWRTRTLHIWRYRRWLTKWLQAFTSQTSGDLIVTGISDSTAIKIRVGPWNRLIRSSCMQAPNEAKTLTDNSTQPHVLAHQAESTLKPCNHGTFQSNGWNIMNEKTKCEKVPSDRPENHK